MLKLYVKTKEWMRDLKKNVEGASLIEYSLLIALISAAVIMLIVAIGGKITNAWTDLNNNM